MKLELSLLVPACRSMDLSASQFFHSPTLLGYNAGRLKRVHRTGESVQFVNPRYRIGNGQGLPCPKFRPTTWTVYLKDTLRSNSQRHISAVLWQCLLEIFWTQECVSIGDIAVLAVGRMTKLFWPLWKLAEMDANGPNQVRATSPGQ